MFLKNKQLKKGGAKNSTEIISLINSFNLWHLLLMITFYYQTKTSIEEHNLLGLQARKID